LQQQQLSFSFTSSTSYIVHCDITPLLEEMVTGKKSAGKGYTPMFAVSPPIPLVKPEETAYEKGSYMVMKLRSSPKDEKSPTHDVMIPYFKSGTCEELLDFLEKVKDVCIGQDMTTGKQKFAFMRQVLKSDALSTWNTVADALELQNVEAGEEAESEDDFQKCLKALVSHVFPLRACVTQTRYMRRYVRKPRDMTMREYKNRLIEMNNQLASFPPLFSEEQKLGHEELFDILQSGIPKSWQKEMINQGFDVMDGSRTFQDLVDFCERQEFIENLSNQDTGKSTGNGLNGKTGPSGGKDASHGVPKSNPKGGNNKKRKSESEPSSKYDSNKFCELHQVKGHDLANCKLMLDQAKKMRAAWDNSRDYNPNYKRDDQKKPYYKPKGDSKELRAMVESMVTEVFKKAEKNSGKKRKNGKKVHFADRSSNEEESTHNEFAGLSLDSDGDQSN
jgi:hypothetical protein